ncbi:MAG: PAS-domain containing protein, partial [bacterium]
MDDERTTRTELVGELKALRQRVAELEGTAARPNNGRRPARPGAGNGDQPSAATLGPLPDILDLTEDGIVSIGEDQRIRSFNKGAEKIFGYTAAEAIGQPLKMLLPEQARENHDREVHKFFRGRQKARQKAARPEISGLRKNGEIFPAEATITKAGKRGARISTALIRDIGDRKKAEDALRASEVRAQETQTRLMEAIESITDGFVMFDREDRLLLCNSRYRQFYPRISEMLRPGAAAGELFRTAFERGTVKAKPEEIDRWFERRMGRFRSGSAPYEQQLADGRWILSTDRETAGGDTVGVRTDITKLKEQEE